MFQPKICQKCGRCPAAGNQLRRCGSCLAVKYCSPACQTEDWASHKLVCKNVAAARFEELRPLMSAAHNGDVATVEKLLKAGAKVDGGAITEMSGRKILTTPLLVAAMAGHAAVIAALLKAGANVDRGTTSRSTPLFMAAQENYKTVLATLLKAGADVNSGLKNGCTPLFIAAMHGHEAVVVALLEAGAQMTATDNGHTPLMAATGGGHTSVVAALRRWTAGIRD
mmetsp:Transcript_9957/g.24503  ORF Transcript_9957/g.24503 Transcript_9957/m.24503 type:complete len:225 (-) Transcript_9957:46-720(-)